MKDGHKRHSGYIMQILLHKEDTKDIQVTSTQTLPHIYLGYTPCKLLPYV